MVAVETLVGKRNLTGEEGPRRHGAKMTKINTWMWETKTSKTKEEKNKKKINSSSAQTSHCLLSLKVYLFIYLTISVIQDSNKDHVLRLVGVLHVIPYPHLLFSYWTPGLFVLRHFQQPGFCWLQPCRELEIFPHSLWFWKLVAKIRS